MTDYGVHIVYFTDYVKAETFDFANDRYTQGTAAYRFFKTYYDAVKATVYNDIMQSHYDSYFDQNKISVENKNIKNLLKTAWRGAEMAALKNKESLDGSFLFKNFFDIRIKFSNSQTLILLTEIQENKRCLCRLESHAKSRRAWSHRRAQGA